MSYKRTRMEVLTIIAIIIAIIMVIIVAVIGIYFVVSGTTYATNTIPEVMPVTDTSYFDPIADAAAKKAAEDAAAKKAAEDAKKAADAAIDSALSEAYGFHAANVCPRGDCMYGILRMKAGECRAMGGAMNGSPADADWADCHVNFGRDAPRGMLPAGQCSSGTCQYGAFTTSARSCRAIGGAMNGTPGDDEQTLCHVNFGISPKYRLFPVGVCPTGTCYPVKFPAVGAQCRQIGGQATGDSWTQCELSLGPATR